MRCALVLSLLFLMACSSKKSVSSQRPDVIEFEDILAAKAALSNDQVFCDGECAESVAAFYLYFEDTTKGSVAPHQIKLCSATLIAKNKILTNKHCIDGVLKAGDICDKNIFAEIKFPKTGSKSFKSYKCKKVVSTSEDYFLEDPQTKEQKKKRQVPDWAVIELTENVLDRAPISVGKIPVSDEDPLPVTLYPVYFDTSKGPPKGMIKSVQCERVYNKDIHIFTNDSDSPLFRIENCSHKLVHGNSGTGVFYKNSTELLGVMATSDSISAQGTMAHCLPDFNSSKVQCIFPKDQEFTVAMKTIAFLNRLSKSIFKQVVETSGGGKVDGIEYYSVDEKNVFSKVKVEYKDSWNESISYLKAQGSEKLASRYEAALLRVLFPQVPKCYRDLNTEKDLLVVDLTNWNAIHDYQWVEKIEKDASGQEMSFVEETVIPEVSYLLRNMRFQVSVIGGEKILKMESSGAPEPIQSLEMRLPPCP